MTQITVKLTAKELELLCSLASDQLFRREFVDSRLPGFKSNPADVRFVLQGMEVNVFSDDYSTAQLITVAKSVRPEDTGARA